MATHRQAVSPEMLAAIRAGDRPTFMEALEHELDALYRFVGRELRYHEALGDLELGEVLPEEIVDEAALRALRQARRIPRRATFTGWLRSLALDVIDDYVRRLHPQHKMEAVSLEAPLLSGQKIGVYYQPDAALTWEDVLPAPVPSPEEAVELRETWDELEQALNALPPAQRLAFVLHAIEGLSYAEIAAIAHQPRSAIKAAYHAAREALRRRFAGRFTRSDSPRTSPASQSAAGDRRLDRGTHDRQYGVTALSRWRTGRANRGGSRRSSAPRPGAPAPGGGTACGGGRLQRSAP